MLYIIFVAFLWSLCLSRLTCLTACGFSEFPTSKLEMEKVADIFDKDRDGFINYKEFVSALRPDRDVSAAVAAK